MNNCIIDITNWEDACDEIMFPAGARDKQIFISPSEKVYDLKVNSFYMFKESVKRHPHQFWSEIIAYHIGIMVNVNVPKAYPAVFKNKNGALIEWFLDRDNTNRMMHGVDYMKKRHADYDIKHGKQHNFYDIRVMSRALSLGNYFDNSYNWSEYWVKVLCFDVIIGNTDRHHGNWGFIFDDDKKCKFTPVFDNGTALGYEIIESNLLKFNDINRIDSYIKRGTHHMKWSINDDVSKVGGVNHFEMLVKLSKLDESIKPFILNMLPSIRDLIFFKEILYKYSEYKIDVLLTKSRCDFILRLVKSRCALIKEKLENM